MDIPAGEMFGVLIANAKTHDEIRQRVLMIAEKSGKPAPVVVETVKPGEEDDGVGCVGCGA